MATEIAAIVVATAVVATMAATVATIILPHTVYVQTMSTTPYNYWCRCIHNALNPSHTTNQLNHRTKVLHSFKMMATYSQILLLLLRNYLYTTYALHTCKWKCRMNCMENELPNIYVYVM